MEKDINHRIKNIMAVVFETTIDKITDDSTAENIENWDSLKHMNLIIALEEEFDISIPDEEVGNMTSFKIIEYIIKENL